MPWVAVFLWAALPLSGQDGVKNGEWRYWVGDAGSTKYATCHSSHSSNLSGNESTPALSGDEFMVDGNGRTVGDLFERIRVTMPLDSPGRLSPQRYGDVVAFLLSSNKFPAGLKELEHDVALLK